MTAIVDGLIATGATFEAVADEARSLGYRLRERRLKPPLAGSVFVDSAGRLHRIRYALLGWVASIDGDSKLHLTRWRKAFAVGGYVLEPERADYNLAVQWFALTLVVVARLLLVMLVSILGQLSDLTLAPLWILTALILASTTYTSITLIHRSQWHDLEAALDAMAPDWIPRLSRDVGGRILAVTTLLGMLILDRLLELSPAIWVVGIGFLFLDLMPTRHFQQAKALTLAPEVRTARAPRQLMAQLTMLLQVVGPGVYVLKTQFPERLLAASENLVRAGEPLTVLGPEAEFLPGTLRSNFAWDASDIGEYHFSNLMDLVGFPHWKARFGGSLNYQIGPNNQGLSSSEASALQVARALAQGADTLILVDALAPMSADRQMQLLNRLAAANCRVLVFSSVSDLWDSDVIDLD